MKEVSEACERNKGPILEQLHRLWHDKRLNILEIGSGTGQHAVHFAKHLPNVHWHTSDLVDRHISIIAWMDDAKLANIEPPFILDIKHPPELRMRVDAIYTSNTAHIMGYAEVVKMFQFAEDTLEKGGQFILYGPFKYDGKHTAESNLEFDKFLKKSNSMQGIRDVSDLRTLSKALELVEDCVMPANNRLLVFQKRI